MPTPTPHLDADQLKPATFRRGNACVAAAAGSGKTTLLVGRAIKLVEAGVHPGSIMTLCFNKNAERTLSERFSQHPLTASHAESMASTFHAFGLRAAIIGTGGNALVLAGSAQEAARMEKAVGGVQAARRTVRDVARAAYTAIGGFRKKSDPGYDPIFEDVAYDDVVKLEPAAREALFEYGFPGVVNDPKALAAALSKVSISDPAFYAEPMQQVLTRFIPVLRAEKRPNERNHGKQEMDFADMLIGLGHFIRVKHPGVMTWLRRVKHLQVDEAQDGNYLRWFITRGIAEMPGDDRSTIAVGDLRQAIAGFTGARPEHFRKWWDESTQFTLPRNYRSASVIVEAGNAVARGEPWNIGGDCIAARADLGRGELRVEPLGALAIGVEVAAAIKAGMSPKDVTVLARTRAALELTAFALRAKGVKASVRGGGAVWSSLMARALRAYLMLSEGGKVDDQEGLVKALNLPLRYVSGAFVGQISRKGAIDTDLLTRMMHGSDRRIAEVSESVLGVLDEMAMARAEAGSNPKSQWEAQVALAKSWLTNGLYEEQERLTKKTNARNAPTDQVELVSVLADIAKTAGSMENLNAVIRADAYVDPKAPDVMVLSTIHQAKGDQWGTVYVTGLKEGVFPHIRATDDEAFAEELRLLYVAVTRPVHTLVLDTAEQQKRFAVKLEKLKKLATRTPKEPAVLTGEDEDDGDDGDDDAELVAAAPAPAPAPAPSKPSAGLLTGGAMDAWGMMSALGNDDTRAHNLTELDPKPAAGQRFVVVTLEGMKTLLGKHGFSELTSLANRFNQRVFAVDLKDNYRLQVYTSIPPGMDAARGLAEDSIKVTLLDPSGRPVARKQPYAARTRNWRVTLLGRLREVLKAHPELKGQVP